MSIFGKARDTNKREEYKIKLLLFLFSSVSIFGKARDTNKREEYKIKLLLFLFSSVSIFGEANVSIFGEAMGQNILPPNFESEFKRCF